MALQPGKVRYRAGDHELMPNIFVGEVHPPTGSPDDVFTLQQLVPGETGRGAGRRHRLQDGPPGLSAAEWALRCRGRGSRRRDVFA